MNAAIVLQPTIKLTQTEADAIVQKACRCTEATLLAFGVVGTPKTGSGCLGFLTNAGFKLERVPEPNWVLHLKKFQQGAYLVLTPGHAMALIGGILVDTERKGFDRRKVQFMWKVTHG
jgi:hypothetical protein